MRFLLGVAEAGFFPGIILYLTYWFTAEERARWIGMFMTAIPLSSVIGGPISGWILDHLNGVAGVDGLAVAVRPRGFACRSWWAWPASPVSTTGPRTARWLDPAERDALSRRLEAERHTARRLGPSRCARRS